MPCSRKRRIISARKSPRKCLSYFSIHDHTPAPGQVTSDMEPEKSQHEVVDGALGEPMKDTPWLCALVSSVMTCASVKLCVLSEATGTSKWLEIIRVQCLIEPTLGPVDCVRLLVSSNTHLYQLQVLYPVPRVVERYKG